MRHLIFVLGLTLDVYRCSLARATGPFSSHGSFCLVQRERTGKLPSSTFVRRHSTPGFDSNTSLAFALRTWRVGKSSRAHGHTHMKFGEYSCKICRARTRHTKKHPKGIRVTYVPRCRYRSAKYETCLTPTRFLARCRPRHIAITQVSPGVTQ